MSRIAFVCAGLICLCLLPNPVAANPLAVASRAGGEAAIAASPTEAAGYLDYAGWLASQGDLHDAVAVLEAGCRQASEPAPVLLDLARLHRRLGKLARAEAVAREALMLRPDLPEIHLAMGDIYLALGWPKSALDSYETAVKLSPGSPATRVSLVTALLESGNIAAAEDRCLEFIAALPQEPDLWLALGQVFEKQDKLREAFTTYGQVLSLDPASAEAFARQGRLFCRFGQYASAADACRQSLQRDADNLTAHAYLGIACSYLGQDEQARHHAQIAEAGGLNMTAVWKKLN